MDLNRKFWEAMWTPIGSKIQIDKMEPIGEDQKGFRTYVGRATVDGNQIPGKFVLEEGTCYVPHGGKEIGISEYELLLDDEYTWVESSNGKIPDNAVVGGITSGNEKLFIGRALHEDCIIPGKIHPSHKCLYIPFGGAEHAHTTYEILVKEGNNDTPVMVPVIEEVVKTDIKLTFQCDTGKQHQPWRKSADKLIECQLCEDRPCDTIIIPCGHGACYRCQFGFKKCFKCGVKIKQLQKMCFG